MVLRWLELMWVSGRWLRWGRVKFSWHLTSYCKENITIHYNTLHFLSTVDDHECNRIFRSSNLNKLLCICFWYLSENMPNANIIEQNIIWWRVAMFWLIYYKGDLIKFITWRSRYSVYTWNSFSIVSVKNSSSFFMT